MVERYHIAAHIRLSPFLRTVHPILKDDIICIGVVEERELHCESIVDIGEGKMMTIGQRLSHHTCTIRKRITIHGVAAYEQSCQMDGLLSGMCITQSGGMECCNTIANTKEEITRSILHGQATNILSGCQAITANVRNPALLIALILPDTHRRATPEVTILVLYHTADDFVSEYLCPRQRHHLTFLLIV